TSNWSAYSGAKRFPSPLMGRTLGLRLGLRPLRLPSQRRQGRAGRDHFGVDLERQDRRTARGDGFLEGRGELLGAGDFRAKRPVRLCEGEEVGVLEVGAD